MHRRDDDDGDDDNDDNDDDDTVKFSLEYRTHFENLLNLMTRYFKGNS